MKKDFKEIDHGIHTILTLDYSVDLAVMITKAPLIQKSEACNNKKKSEPRKYKPKK